MKVIAAEIIIGMPVKVSGVQRKYQEFRRYEDFGEIEPHRSLGLSAQGL